MRIVSNRHLYSPPPPTPPTCSLDSFERLERQHCTAHHLRSSSSDKPDSSMFCLLLAVDAAAVFSAVKEDIALGSSECVPHWCDMVVVCLRWLQQLQVTNFGQINVAAPHPGTFDPQFRQGEASHEWLAWRYCRQQKPWWGVILKMFWGLLS